MFKITKMNVPLFYTREKGKQRAPMKSKQPKSHYCLFLKFAAITYKSSIHGSNPSSCLFAEKQEEEKKPTEFRNKNLAQSELFSLVNANLRCSSNRLT